MIEVELKAWLTDFERTQRALEGIGAEFLGDVEKRDHYYGPAGKTAKDIDMTKDPVCRIRTEEGKAFVTAKRRELTPEGVEVNREIELRVDDAASFRELLQYLGYRPFIVKRKRTRKYKLGRASVELHVLDPLGDFIEIEVLVEDDAEVDGANAEIRALLERVGIPKEKIEPRLYIDMLREIGAGRP